jgi:ABC-2 type transport system permease protein
MSWHDTAASRSLKRLFGFILKEWRQILRNRHLLYLLLIPPTIQLAILAYALRPGVDHMNLGIVDFSRSKESNELVSSLCSYKIFNPLDFGVNEEAMVESLSKGAIGAAVVIPRNFSKDLDQGGNADVQVLMDGVDAYSSGIAKSYIIQTFTQFTPKTNKANLEKTSPFGAFGENTNAGSMQSSPIAFTLPSIMTDGASANSELEGDRSASMNRGENPEPALDGSKPRASSSNHARADGQNLFSRPSPSVKTELSILYNPDLRSSWYFIPGVLGGVITLVGILVSSAALLREKEFGTLDQVLVSPYSNWEIFVGKIAPIFVLLLTDLFLALAVAMILFQLPFRGDVSLFLLSSILYLSVVVGFGMILSTTCAAQRQAQLASYLVLIPVILLSGSLVPANTMPQFMQEIAAFNPLLHYTHILRSVFLKAGDWAILWQHVLVLFAFAVVEWTFCINRFFRLRS